MLNPNVLYHDWNNIYQEVVNKAQTLLGRYDCLVAIGTGGFIPAKILREQLRIPCYSITVESYTPDYQQEELRVLQWIDSNYLADKRVLLVDDIDDTGKTLAFCRELLLNPKVPVEPIYDGLRGPESLPGPKTLDVFVIDNKRKPKEYLKNGWKNFQYHYCFDSPGDQWIVYPWEYGLIDQKSSNCQRAGQTVTSV